MKKRKRKRTSRTGLWLITLMVLCMCGVIAYQKQNLEQTKVKVEYKLKELNKKIEAEEERSLDIEEKKSYVQTYDYIEKMGREKLGLVYEEEIIFKSNQK